MVKHHLISTRAVPTYMALIAILLLSSIAHGGGLLFVDDDAPLGGDGISWDSAYRFLADALVAAGKGQVGEIRVAQGVYKPDRDEANPDGTGDREATFQLINSLALMGGYAGIGAKDPDARDIELYETILSGDLLGNDEPDFVNNDENSYHVVRGNAIDETAVLDGFVITAGNADGSGDQRSGGGMFNTTIASPTVTSCTFVANSADLGGGGMCNIEESSPTVIDCTFNGNLAGSPVATGSTSENANTPAGGGMYNSEASSPTIIGCTFLANAAPYGGGMTNAENSSPTVNGCTFSDNSGADGGGMLNVFSSNPAVTDCIFSGNSASWRGGGMYNFGDCNPTVTNCTFSDNSAGDGGGMYNLGYCDPTVTNCTFSDNSAGESGGGMLNFFNSNPTVTNCTFSGNWAEEGGGMLNSDSSPAITNCAFSGNTAEEDGGGMFNAGDNSPSVTNCTFRANSAGLGGGIYSRSNSSLTVNNCTIVDNSSRISGGGIYSTDEFGGHTIATVYNSIVWGNAPDEIVDVAGAVTTVNYSDVQGGWPGSGNIDADPMFVDPNNGDYHLSPGSPCIDAADNTAVPKGIDIDLDGNPRFVDDPDTDDTGFGDPPIVDMGAYEFQLMDCPWDVNGDGVVDHHDIVEVVHNLGRCNDPDNCPWDINGDGIVNGRDVAAVAMHFGPCPKE